MTDAFLERVATALRGRYDLIRQLGQGGMGAVFLARDLKLGREVAIKVLLPHVRAALGPERFQREVEVVSKLSHPHIVKLFEADEVDGIAFYVMDHVEGESLQQRLEREGPIGLKDALRIAAEVGDALQYAHEHRIIHRDIKPANILLSRGHALVSDFGIAKSTVSDGGTLTSEGVAVGTAPYMSPEQAGGEKKVDGRSDVYSLAAVLYEMLVGEAPFTGKSVQAIIARVMSDAPRPLRTTRSTVPAYVEAAVLDALAKTPADRPASAQEFIARLTAGPEARSLLSRRAITVVAVVGLTAILLGSGTWGLWKRFTNRAPPGMVLIPGGEYMVFGGNCPRCLPEHRATLSPFYIDRTEVPVVEYEKYIKAAGIPIPWPARPTDSMPVTGVFWSEADGYCRWRHRTGRLPSEEEWEAAARGVGRRLYPWGAVWEEGRSNADNSHLGLLPVGRAAAGSTPEGVVDLVGNAWEWTASFIGSQPVIRGGAHNSPRTVATTVYRTALPGFGPARIRQTNYENTGFRCVQPHDLRSTRSRDAGALALYPTSNPVAYDHFLKGMAAFSFRLDDPQYLQRALLEFETATKLDPRFAKAHARIGLTYGVLVQRANRGVSRLAAETLLAHGFAATGRALNLDSTSSEAWLARGALLSQAGKLGEDIFGPAKALAAYRRARELDPNNADAQNGYGVLLLYSFAELDSSRVAIQRASRIDPSHATYLQNLALIAYTGRRFAEAGRWWDSAVALAPRSATILEGRAMLRLTLNDTAGAFKDATDANWLQPDWPWPRAILALTNLRRGNSAAAQNVADSLIAEAPVPDANRGLAVSALLTALGQDDGAMEYLERVRPSVGYTLPLVLRYPVLDPLRSSPKFQRVVARSLPPGGVR